MVKSPSQARRPQAVHSRCVQLDVRDMTQAVSLFSTKNDMGEIPLVLIPVRRARTSMFLKVPVGVSCLLQKWGKDNELASPGLKFYPWYYRIGYVVTNQSCTYNAPVQQCPTSDNVMVQVDCTVVS
jgi:regulator of protease activity HflC (stomatin/prohibitin superfamily)